MKTQTGMTLIELLSTVTIVAILASVALPNLSEFVKNNKIISVTNDVVSALQLARAEAVKRKVLVAVCGSSNGTSCNSSSWENGLIVFTDLNGDYAVTGGADEILLVQNAVINLTIRTVSFTSADKLRYNARGAVDSDGTFKICDSRGVSMAKAVNVNITGRVRMATDDNNNGTVNDTDGSDIACP